MIEKSRIVNKDFEESPFASLLNKVTVVKPRDSRPFSGMLKGIKGQHLAFEMRSGMRVVLHADDILSIFEVVPRRR